MEQKPSFVMPTVVQSTIVGVVLSVISTIFVYVSISGEPSGSFFQPISFLQMGICLLGAVAGVLSVKAYVKTGVEDLQLGQGALIGLFAGLVSAVVMTLIGVLWNFVVDPALMDNMADYMIRNMEMAFANSGMGAEQVDQILGEMEKGFEEQKTFVGILKGFGFSVLGLGIINVISGLITAKVVSKD